MPNHKILFIIPPCFMNRQLDFEIGFPIQLLLLGNIARTCGWRTDYYDMTLEEKEGYDSFTELVDLLCDRTIKLVGISNHTVRTSVTTRSVAEFIQSHRPDIKILVGGVNATFMWRELLSQTSAIDYVLRGYAQAGLRALLDMFPSKINDSIPGLAYRSNGKYQANPNSPIISSDFTPPFLTDLNVSRYLAWTKTYSLLTHTGCGFSCSFCTSAMPDPCQRKEVYRPIQDVISEMIQAIEVGFDHFYMSANVFTSNKDYCLELCEAVQRASIHKCSSWVCMTRVELIDPELLLAMKASGCMNIAYGVEVADAHVWDHLNKGYYSRSEIKKAFNLTKKTGIGTTAYLMLGTPMQTRDTIETTKELIHEICPDFRVVSFFQPYPGTPYWNNPEHYGLSDIAPFEEWNFHEQPLCCTKYFDKAELQSIAIQLILDLEDDSVLILSSEDWAASLINMPNDGCEIPEVVMYTFSLMNGMHSIGEILEIVTRHRGTRGRLVALYWLAAAIRKGHIIPSIGIDGNVNQSSMIFFQDSL